MKQPRSTLKEAAQAFGIVLVAFLLADRVYAFWEFLLTIVKR